MPPPLPERQTESSVTVQSSIRNAILVSYLTHARVPRRCDLPLMRYLTVPHPSSHLSQSSSLQLCVKLLSSVSSPFRPPAVNIVHLIHKIKLGTPQQYSVSLTIPLTPIHAHLFPSPSLHHLQHIQMPTPTPNPQPHHTLHPINPIKFPLLYHTIPSILTTSPSRPLS